MFVWILEFVSLDSGMERILWPPRLNNECSYLIFGKIFVRVCFRPSFYVRVCSVREWLFWFAVTPFEYGFRT